MLKRFKRSELSPVGQFLRLQIYGSSLTILGSAMKGIRTSSII